MGKLIIEGWSKPGDEIPQPTGILMGRNLRPPQPAHGTREGAAVHREVHRERKEGGPVMGTLRLSKPDDLMYREGPQSYSPHWARQFVKPAAPKPPETEPPKDDDAPVTEVQ
jgi:hypothetical protein